MGESRALSPFSPRVVFSMYLLLSCCSFILFLLHIYISCIYIDVIQPFHAIKKLPRPPAPLLSSPNGAGAHQRCPRHLHGSPPSLNPPPHVGACWASSRRPASAHVR